MNTVKPMDAVKDFIEYTICDFQCARIRSASNLTYFIRDKFRELRSDFPPAFTPFSGTLFCEFFISILILYSLSQNFCRLRIK